MIAYEELVALNRQIVEEAVREMGQEDRSAETLQRIVGICEDHIERNEALKRRLPRDRDYQLRCHAIDTRTVPLKEILREARRVS